MAIKFLHTPRNKRFDYKPRYYDEQKEELEERIKKIKREMGVDENDSKHYIPNIKGQMRGSYSKNLQQKRKSTTRLVVILIALLALVYFLLFS